MSEISRRPDEGIGSAEAADDADGQRPVEAKWVTNGDGHLPNLNSTRVAKWQRVELIGRRFDLQHGQVTQ